MYNGCNVLTAGWDNSTDWTLTFTGYFSSTDGCGFLIKDAVTNATTRDRRQIQICNYGGDRLRITNRDPSSEDYEDVGTASVGVKTIKVIKKTSSGTTQYKIYIGTSLKRTVTNASLTSTSRIMIGIDWWYGTNSSYITDVKVKKS